MNTWFTTEPMIISILAKGLDVIDMVKQLKQRYNFKSWVYTLPELQNLPILMVRAISLAPFVPLLITESP